MGAHEAYRLKVRERRRRKSRAAALSAWTATAAAFVVILTGLVLFRGEVVKRWPESASTYAVIGMPVNRFGLEFMETEAERFFDGTTPILEVRGAVQNVTSSTVAAPLIRVILLDDQGFKVAEAFAPIQPSSIPEEAIAVFAARVENPPFESFELELDLVPARYRDCREQVETIMSHPKFESVLSEADLMARIDDLAQRLAPRLEGEWSAINILIGATPFTSDLMKALARLDIHPVLDALLAGKLPRCP